MKNQKSIVLGALGVMFAFCAAFASNVVVQNQRAWYNAELNPLNPTNPVFATITSPSNTSTAALECSVQMQSVICTINGQQAFRDQGLTQPLTRGF